MERIEGNPGSGSGMETDALLVIFTLAICSLSAIGMVQHFAPMLWAWLVGEAVG
jgi:hypothetical protein